MNTYYLQGVMKNPPQEVVNTVANFWKDYAKVEIKTPPLPYVYLATMQDLYDWVYHLYLINWQEDHNILLHGIIIIPQKCLGDFRTLFDAKGFQSYQIAVIGEQSIGTMKFLATHELGHLLGLLHNGQGHHWLFPLNCIMTWLPTFLIPLRWRKVCDKCKIRLGG